MKVEIIKSFAGLPEGIADISSKYVPGLEKGGYVKRVASEKPVNQDLPNPGKEDEQAGTIKEDTTLKEDKTPTVTKEDKTKTTTKNG